MTSLYTIVLVCILFLRADAIFARQTVELVYKATNPKAAYREYFAFDYMTGAATRIDALGNIQTIDPTGNGSTGKAGAASLNPADHLGFRNARRMASVVMPQLIVRGIEDDPAATLLTEAGELGGPTYSGEYATGNRLVSAEDLQGAINVAVERVYYDFDNKYRLARIRYENSDRVNNLDLAENSTANISYVNSFGNGMWKLADVRISNNTNVEVFQPAYIVALARDDAIELAQLRAESQSERAATPEGQRELERIRDEAIGTGLPQSTKRFALILTGLIVIAVGSLAWWKHRG